MGEFWLTDEQFAKIAPHLPTDTRGKERVDDRRVISGIIHVLKSGGRWTDAPREIYGPKKTLYNRFVRWAAKGIWRDLFETLARAGWPPSQVLIDSSAVKAASLRLRWKGGEQSHAIGRSRGGRTTKIHALTDRFCRPLAFLLTGGQVADCKAGAQLLEGAPACRIMLADKGLRQRRHPPSDRGDRGRRPTSRPSPTGDGSRASPPSCTRAATPSSGCSGASRTSAASPPDTTGWQPTTWRPSASPLPSATGYESGA
ncbi:transposase [Methylorubrum extorquens]|nr:transposase [Methylorubrum extorquens]